MKEGIIIKGYLLHLTHYDPRWYLRKFYEKPINIDLAKEIIDALSYYGFNLLIVDCADGVVYKSHRELKRRYSISQKSLKHLLEYARNKGLSVVPKLNFSHSHHHRHNHWFRPYCKILDTPRYWRIAFELVKELVEIFEPFSPKGKLQSRFFHIGMDEDDTRSYTQYLRAIRTLREGLRKYHLLPIMWNDSAQEGKQLKYAQKILAVEDKLPKDIVQIVWDYNKVKPEIIKRLVKKGIKQVWVAPGLLPEQVKVWKKTLLRYGGKGLVMTTWIPMRKHNRSKLLKMIEALAPLYKD